MSNDRRRVLARAWFGAGGGEIGGKIEKGSFRVSYDDRGITGLANPQDPFGAQMIPPGQRLGLTVKFKTDRAEWRDVVSRSGRMIGCS